MSRPAAARDLSGEAGDLARRIRGYWNERIHDLEMTPHEPGTLEFFDDLDAYRFDKLRYLPRLVDFFGFAGRRLLEIGCGIGTDLVRFARGGAHVIGVDLSDTAIHLARKNVRLHGVGGADRLLVGDGSALPLQDASVDVVYAHGVLQYAADARGIVQETRRVLRPGGRAIFMVYNRRSWLMALSRVMKVPLEHEDAPGLTFYTIAEFRRLLNGFSEVSIVPERFPVRSRLHRGWKAVMYNGLFVGAFNLVPRPLVRRFGFHLMGLCRK
jgi:ubiquinone/menaquinone biosynthesis C-methylase UbiE